jgi:hypothetical protein
VKAVKRNPAWRRLGRVGGILGALRLLAAALFFAYMLGRAQSPAGIEEAPKEDR